MSTGGWLISAILREINHLADKTVWAGVMTITSLHQQLGTKHHF